MFSPPRMIISLRRPEIRSRPEASIEPTSTPAGQTALRDWLAEPGALPSLEFDGLLKVLYADHGDRAAMLATLRNIQDQAQARLDIGRALAREYLYGTGPFPDRVHVNALAWDYLRRHHQMTVDWAAWAASIVDEWTDTALSSDKTSVAIDVFSEGLNHD